MSLLKRGVNKVDEVLKNSLLESMKDNYQQAEKTVAKFDKVKDRLEKFV